MVIQQNKVNRIWGWAKAEQLVTVGFSGKKYSAFADSRGKWEVFLEPSKAGNAGAMTVAAGENVLEVKNILAGEVWVCSGQSNMEWSMVMVGDPYKEEMQSANNDNIRYLVVKRTIANTPQEDVTLEKPWSPITPATIGDCSAVAYWYAKALHQNLKVPIGLVVTSWGGSFSQSWTSFEGLYDFPNYTTPYIEKVKPLDLSTIDQHRQAVKEKYLQSIRDKSAFLKEAATSGYDDSKWNEMSLPKEWEAQGYPTLDGMVVYRIPFDVAEADAGKEAVLNLPAVDDMDSTYINGTFIGTTNQWNALRTYSIPPGVLKSGKNILVILVQDDGGGGGLSPAEEKYNVVVNSKVIPLAGKAKYSIVAVLEDITGGFGAIDRQPAVVFNAMIAPLLPLSIRGVIWYQGESNAGNGYEYRTLFPALIKDWRNRWGQGEFPFLFVQLASFGAIDTVPSQSNWAELREAQTQTLSLPNTAMAVTVDIGDSANVHPQKKKEVGDRLAAGAMKIVYGEPNRVSSGPQLKNYTVRGHQVIITFSNAEHGLRVKGKRLKHFAIAGADKRFVWADAVVKGNQIVVSSKQVQKPVAVRYAWADSPMEANLFNRDGFPAIPFRTDDWK
ncbi:MAG: beta galactosidase jelly roll domain-containing protein [Ignavibacteriae bacterium]|nr:beta galactosidase jelly roll domain-containing protein [Ignavibacteriota bacterium]